MNLEIKPMIAFDRELMIEACAGALTLWGVPRQIGRAKMEKRIPNPCTDSNSIKEIASFEVLINGEWIPWQVIERPSGHGWDFQAMQEMRPKMKIRIVSVEESGQ